MINERVPDKYLMAFIAYHESVDAAHFVCEAAKIGISNSNDHKNQNIVYINRYDWVRASSLYIEA